ncbi:uncharacterized protein BX664DRAFT_256156 [Halteromyces radiatus]|uniref:uncharacterized protein n=1 Tax=Halteromyces radiatus TaxID=101107 RepID=UPI002220DDA5|nr:uncharacterized protein BX664DRAFT_256156 [Halteromyces radiatus]KAI8099762.1 hypothetical protein BX664DRAFT_256156 [Halteromyces radiatus]
MIKRHSITSLISGNGDLYYNSRPGSILYSTTTSQPDSPRILFMKDGQLWDDNNEDVDDYFLDNNNNNSQQYDLLPTHLHRWTLKHDLLKLALNGCGDGTWCIDVAMANPKWTVIGMEENGYDHYMTTANESDDTTCFGSLSHGNGLFKPRNMRLIRCAPSLLHALQQMPDHVFDLVDGRCLILGYSFETYRQLIKECWRVCKIGGYVELIEMDMRMYHSKIPKTMGKTIQTLNSEVIHMMESRSLDPRLARRLPDILEEIIMESISTSSTTSSTSSNAVHITSAKYTSLPIGVWGGRLGVMFREDLHTLMESVQVWISQYKESDCRSDQDLEKELDQMDNEMELQRSFMNLHHCYAQKTC